MSTIKPVKPKAPSTKRVPNIPQKMATKPSLPKMTVMKKAGRGR